MATRPIPNLTLEAAQIASQGAQEKAKAMGIGKSSPHTTRFPSAHPWYPLTK